MSPKRHGLRLPQVFVASSGKALEIAHAIPPALTDVAIVNVWDSAFSPSTWTLQAILDSAAQSDFGIFVIAPDDDLGIKGEKMFTVRDNVLFELGVFMGALGHERTFVLWPEGGRQKLRLPSDLEGLTRISYAPPARGESPTLASAVGVIRKTIEDRGYALRSGYNEIAALKRTLEQREQRFKKHESETFKDILGRASARRPRHWFALTEVRQLTDYLEADYTKDVIDHLFWWLIVDGVITFDNIEFWSDGDWHYDDSVDNTQFSDRGIVLMNELRQEYGARSAKQARRRSLVAKRAER